MSYLILPYISYCNILWATCKAVTHNILLLQKKAIRVCTRSGFRDHTNPLFVKFKCLKVDDIHFLQTAILCFAFYCLTLFLLCFDQSNQGASNMQFTHTCIPLGRFQISQSPHHISHKSIHGGDGLSLGVLAVGDGMWYRCVESATTCTYLANTTFF